MTQKACSSFLTPHVSMFNHYFSLVISVVDGLELLPIDIIALERNRQF